MTEHHCCPNCLPDTDPPADAHEWGDDDWRLWLISATRHCTANHTPEPPAPPTVTKGRIIRGATHGGPA
jgi:hypothetical protein